MNISFNEIARKAENSSELRAVRSRDSPKKVADKINLEFACQNTVHTNLYFDDTQKKSPFMDYRNRNNFTLKKSNYGPLPVN